MHRLAKLLFVTSVGIAALTWLAVGTRAAAPQVPANTWVSIGDMADIRAGASGTMLPDGTVLVAGGVTNASVTASVDRFSPMAGAFMAAPAMSTARANHTATLLTDGRVLVAGGAGGGGVAVNGAEIYDPASNSWAAVGPLNVARRGHTAALLADGTVLVAGGDDNNVATDTLERFDPSTLQFSLLAAKLSAPRTLHAQASLADGRVLIAGGFDGTGPLQSMNIFDPMDDSITAGPTLSTPRSGLSATTLLGGKVLVAGGVGPSGELATAEIFDPKTFSLTTADNTMGVARQNHLALVLPHNNHVLIVGGSAAGQPVATAEYFTPWEGTNGLFCSAPVCASGYAGPGLPSSARTWAAGSALSFPASDTVRSGPNDGLALVAGGTGQKSAELFGFATIRTDKADYAPGSTVTITGSGWQPGESVALVLREDPLLDTHQLLSVTADSGGNIVSTEFSPDWHDIGIRFYLTAFGQASQAQTTFTDAAPTLTMTGSGSGNGTVTSSDNFINCTITAAVTSGSCSKTYGGNGSTTLTATPAGGFSFGGWSNGCTGTSTTCLASYSGNSTTTVNASFSTVNVTNSTVIASPTSVTADGTSTSTITVTLKDANNNPVSGLIVSLVAGSGSSTITTVSGTSNGSGQATFTVKDAVAQGVTYTATSTGVTISQTASVTFVVGAVSASTSTVVASPTSVTANGTSTSTITVTLKDATNNVVSGKAVSLSAGSGSSIITTTAGTTNAIGQATFTVKDAVSQTVTYTATDTTDSNLVVAQTATVTFTAGPVSASVSTVGANPSLVPADGLATSTITVTLKDANGNPVSGNTVTLAKSGGSSTVSGGGSSNSSGIVTFTVKDSVAETTTYTATATTGTDVTINQKPAVTFFDVTPPISSVTSPANNGAANTLVFAGNASDNAGGSGVAIVELSIRQGSGNYWDGTGFNSSAEVFNLATGTTSWTYAIAVASPDGAYTVRSRATDNASNVQTPGTGNTFALDQTPPVTASVTSPVDGTNFSTGTGPASFSGSAADDSGGAGLNANSTTFTLQQMSTSLYWNGTAFASATPVNRATTHLAQSGATAVTWSSSGPLPSWSAQGAGDYFVQATAKDKAGNTFSGGQVTFRIQGAVTPTALATASNNGPTTTLVSPVLSGMSVQVGRTIFVTVAMDGGTGAVSVTDGTPNIYSKDADVTTGTGTGHVRTLIFSSRVTTSVNGTITITSASSVNMAATFFSFNGLASPSADKFQTGTGNGSDLDSGATATTSQPDEVLVGAMGLADRTQSLTAGGGFSNLAASSTGGQSTGNGVLMQPEYKVVTATGAYNATATGNANKAGPWAAAIGTYKITTPVVSSISRNPADGNPVNNGDTVHFTVTFSQNVSFVDTADFSVAQSGVSGSLIASISGSGTSYTVNITIGTGTGTVGLNLVDNDSIKNLNSIPLGGTGAGNGNFTGETYTTPATVATSTAVSSSANPSSYGASVTFTATVSPNSGSATPTGSIAFVVDGGTATAGAASVCPLGSPANSLCATYSTAALAVNGGIAHTVQATYTHTGNFLDSSGSLSGGQIVSKTNQLTLLAVTGVPATAQAFDATFTVGSTGGDGTGAISFTATGACSNAGAVVTMTGGTGTCSVTATKAADANYNSTTSAAVTVAAKPADQATLSVTGVPGVAQAFGASFTVASSGGSGTGAVSFIATGACSNAGAAVTMTSGTGACSVTATKAADANYNSTTSAAATVAAKPADQATLSVTGVPGVAQAFGASFTVASSGGSGTGVVSFNASGACSNAGALVTMTSGTGTCSVTATKAADNNYNSITSGSAAVAAKPADAHLSVSGFTGPYDGSAHGAAGSATGVENPPADLSSLLHLGSTFMDAPGGTAHWVFDGNANYNASAGDAAITINKVNASINVTGFTGPYDGNAHGASGSAMGVESTPANLSSLLHLGATFTNAPGGTAHWTFDGNTNYNGGAGDVTVTINKVNASVNVTGFTGSYDGAAHGASGSAMGVESTPANLSSLLHLGATFTDAPGGTAHWTFDGNTNYNSGAGDVAITINKANANVTVNGYSGTYDGSAHGASGSAMGVESTPANLSSLLHLGATFTDVPGGTAHWTFDGNTNYNATSGNVAIDISKAPSVVALSGMGTFPYDGTAHGATATVSGAGGLNQGVPVAYSGACSAAPSNVAQTPCTVTATYAGDGNHTGDSKSGTITITAVAPTLSATGGTFTYDGAAHPASGTAKAIGGSDVAGTFAFVYTPGGSYAPKNASATPYGATGTFTSTDSNYTSGGSAATTITINQASSTVTVTCPAAAPTYTGTSIEPCTAAASGAGNLNQSLIVAYTNNVNAGTASASATFAGDANHTGSTGSGSFTITPASSTVTVTCPVAAPTYTGSAIEPCAATATGAGNLSQPLTVVYTNNVNAGTASASATFVGDANHTGNSGSGSFTINQAASTVTVNCPTTAPTYTGSAIEPCTATASGTGNLSQPLTVAYTSNVNAGTASATATFAGDGNHTGNTGSGSFTINQASSSVVLSGGGTFPYDGTGHSASATVSGAGGLSQGAPVAYSGACSAAPSNVAQTPCTVTATYAGDANHTGDSKSGTITITAVAPTLSATGGTFPYDGAAHAASGTAKGVGGSDVAGTFAFVYTPGGSYAPKNASATPYGATGTFTSTDSNYASGGSAATTITISQASSTTTVTGGTFPYDGSAHTATVSVTGAGGLSLTPSPTYSGSCSAAPVTVAQGATCTASYTFAGDANHTGSTGSAAVTITAAQVKVTVGSASPTYDGTSKTVSLSVSPSSAASAVVLTYTSGSPAYNSTTGPSNAGTYAATATFSDPNYAFTGDSVTGGTLTINRAHPTLTTAGGTYTYDGNPHGSTGTAKGLDGVTNIAGSFTYTYVPGGSAAPVNASPTPYGVSALFTSVDPNYDNGTPAANSITITKAPATVTMSSQTFVFDGSAKSATATTTPAGLSLSLTYNGASTPPSAVGTYTVVATITDANYAGSANATLTIAAWRLTGFYSPVDMSTTTMIWNTVKGGSTVPLKFNIYAGTTEVTSTSEVQGFTVNGVMCSGGDADDIEFVTTGGTVLRYDTTGRQFIQNWKTPGTPGACFEIIMTARDGSTISKAYFRLK